MTSRNEEIADDIADMIRTGEWRIEESIGPDLKLPSSRRLAKIYGVTPRTIVDVMIRLKERGLVVGRRGVGTFLTDHARHLQRQHQQPECPACNPTSSSFRAPAT